MPMLHHGKLAELSEYFAQCVDVFVCSASYEARSLSIVQNLRLADETRVIVARNIDSHRRTHERFSEMSELLKRELVEAQLKRHDPLCSAEALNHALLEIQKEAPQRFLIDITTFTREALLILFRVLQFRLRARDEVSFVYAHAKEYSLGDPPQKKWLSRGIREIRSVLGYPGDLLPARPVHLVVLVGFEYDRAVALIREHEPSIISIGCANEDEEGTMSHRDTHRERALRLMRTFGAASTFEFPCYDAEGAADAIRRELERTPNVNTIVAPMNTKVSTIGAALVASQNDAVQLCYAEADIYNYERYSQPDEDYYHFSVPDALRYAGTAQEHGG